MLWLIAADEDVPIYVCVHREGSERHIKSVISHSSRALTMKHYWVSTKE